MNRNAIKLIAALTMTLDHIAVIMLPADSLSWLILRSLGRIAFVLFAMMIAEGFLKTSNLKHYFLRLFAFAAIIEIALVLYYFISSENYLISFNVIWPLVFGLGALILLKQSSIWLRLLVIPVVILAEISGIPYGSYGVLIIVIFALYPNRLTQLLFLVGLNLLYISEPLMSSIGLGDVTRYQEAQWFQWFSLLAFCFIFFYNGQKGRWRSKWFFYIFYPAHLGIIYLINFLIVR